MRRQTAATGRWVLRHASAALCLLWPPVCPHCESRAQRPAVHFCDACWAALRPLRPGRPGDLLPGTPTVHAAFSVDARFVRILTTSKYGRYRKVGLHLCALSAGRLAGGLPSATLVPVPLTRTKRRERGFNQTEDFARELHLATGLPVQTGWLRRCRGGPALAGMARAERAVAVRGAFRPSKAFPGADAGPLLLVEDVVTTGSTTRSCADALEVAGNRPVGVVAMARAFAPADDAARRGRDFLGRL